MPADHPDERRLKESACEHLRSFALSAGSHLFFRGGCILALCNHAPVPKLAIFERVPVEEGTGARTAEAAGHERAEHVLQARGGVDRRDQSTSRLRVAPGITGNLEKPAKLPLQQKGKCPSRHLKGWSNYLGRGYSRDAFRRINAFVRDRLTRRLNRRSRRPYRPPEGVTWYAQLDRLGLVYL